MKLKKQYLRAVSGALAASVMAAMILTSCGGTTPPASSSNPASSSTNTSQPSSSSSSSSSDAFSVGVVGDVFGVPLETVYYGGSEAAWKQIDIATGNDKLSSAEKHYNTKLIDLHF